MEFALEKADQALFAEIQPLLEAHYHEIAHFKDIALEPDWERYEAFEKLGFLRVFTLRLEGKLIGYQVFFVQTNPHYKSCLQAVQDILFIHPDYRGRGRKFIEFCDAWLKVEGVHLVVQHIKAAHNFGPMLERMGYQLVDLVYARKL